MSAQENVVFFEKIDKSDLPLVGGKGANLGEMTKEGFPVPNGFAITVRAYDSFLSENKLLTKIEKTLSSLDVDSPDHLASASEAIERLITKSKIPDSVASETIRAYKKLSGIFKNSLVAVRSSATAEDLPNASFAGQQATFLNVKGEANLLVKVRECWASLFTARAIFYRKQNKIPDEKVRISVIVQKMVQSEVSGVMFSIDPVTNEKDKIVIEAVWGLGEMIVQGLVVPDRYVIQKETFAILSKEISDQAIQLIKVGQKTIEKKVDKKLMGKQKISDDEIIKLAKLADSLQKHYFHPQDIEWAKEKKTLYITQTRPVTTLGIKRGSKEVVKKIEKDETQRVSDTPILEGTAASPGIATGHVQIVNSPKEINKVSEGEVLVAKMTSPDFVPAMKRASAIITDEGGLTSHAAIVSRELGVPCIVGTRQATKRLNDGNLVTVDGTKGLVFLGSKVSLYSNEKEKAKESEKYSKVKTATRLYVNLAEPERAKEISELNVEGVGLLRAEFMIADIGIHPKEAIKLKKQDIFVQKLAKNLSLFCKHFSPRPVVYRATDFKTNEYRSLEGGENWEPQEPNPMLGFRGAFRYIAYPEVFNLELQAMTTIREKYKNLWLMIPFVRSSQELGKVRRLVQTAGLFDQTSFKFWMMVELPVNVISIQEFIDVGIDGVSIGSNDLSMLISGTDRDNSEVAQAFDERSTSVLWAIKRVIRICKKNKVSTSICGQAPSVYEDLVEFLVKKGITSISVNPDAVNRVRGVIAETEKEMLK